MSKFAYGVGFIGIGNYSTDHVSYNIWRAMIRRCYSKDKWNTSYKNCSVVEQWHNFQNFADWYNTVIYNGEGWQLDKDLLSEDNKIYSPTTCLFLPVQINTLFRVNTNKTGLPAGITKKKDRYLARINKNTYLGSFSSLFQAQTAYNLAKANHVILTANSWKDKIDPRAYNKLNEKALDLLEICC